ncbi:hypothetical protein BD289DRAFT_451718 [Coniella lustricola]|uniref:Uncharacterized protein n=1 Tax=Coniella lustricola TaxID=2025994 RepID=A0A2T3ADW3_9PEZI|nr:hypothetical protein BD289DRAFT_451718 [Coniella lustricola]
MQFRAYIVSAALAVLGGSNVASAVCSGNQLAIAVGADDTTSATTSYTIFDTSCNSLATYSVADTPGLCDSQYFYCTTGTKQIGEYNDPTTGWSYTCTVDSGEVCGSSTVSYCVGLLFEFGMGL